MLSLLPVNNAISTNENLITIPLTKQYVPVMKANITIMHKTAYFGSIFVGSPTPQRFTAIFDTGSGHFFLPSKSCESETCANHRRYDPALSKSVTAINHEGTSLVDPKQARDKVRLEFGNGGVEGDFVYEVTCLTEHIDAFNPLPDDCIMVRVITATEMSPEPFELFAFDGVVGLGLESLALHPQFSFFGQMTQQGRSKEQRFAFFISKTDNVPSEISFGGYDETRVSEEIRWAPVFNPHHGHWRVQIRNIWVGDEPLPRCNDGDCFGIVDSGTSLLGVPKVQVKDVHWRLARQVRDGMPELDCRGFPGPDVVFDIGDFNLTLGPEDYSRPKALLLNNSQTGSSQVLCRGSLLPVDLGDGSATKAWIFGEPVLRKYYTVFDWGRQQIGFAPAVHSRPSMATHSPAKEADYQQTKHMVLGSPSGGSLTPTIVQI